MMSCPFEGVRSGRAVGINNDAMKRALRSGRRGGVLPDRHGHFGAPLLDPTGLPDRVPPGEGEEQEFS
jgi:hypothetical protein